jgi:hypothetical protein
MSDVVDTEVIVHKGTAVGRSEPPEASEFVREHIKRIRAATTHKLRMGDVPRWVEENTTINGRPYSFKNHEYQMRTMGDESQEIVIRKCSQIGISEAEIRKALGLVAVMPHYSIIYTFPTATFASTYVKTRVDPVIQGSPALRSAISNSVDSSEVKQVGHNFLYFKGAQAGNSAISVSADHLIHDELDFSDMTIIGQYHSRLTHSPFRRKTKLSTPTLPNGPIDKAFQMSRRYWNFCKCNHCGHRFIPNYYEHVKIPGFDDDLRRITKENLHRYDYKNAKLLCPACFKVPSLQPEHREWVCENPDQNFLAVGYQIQPFDAPNLIKLHDLIEASTQYDRLVDFQNFNLGIPAEDKDNGLTSADLERAGVTLISSPFSTHVLGADMGLICRVTIGNVTQEGELLAVHYEEVPIGNFKKRYRELCAEYRVTVKVLDSQPYVETVMSLQDEDANLYGAFFVRKEKLELYDTSTREENIEAGKTALRQVNINRNKALDMLMDDIRHEARPLVLIKKGPLWDKLVSQCIDMKRVKKLTDDNEFVNVWVKSDDKNDHFHFSLLYLWIAAKLRGTAVGGFESAMMGVSKFKLQPDPQDKTRFGGVVVQR